MSYFDDGSGDSIPDIFDMKHLHRKKTKSSTDESWKSPEILGTVIKVESRDEGPSFLSEEARSIDSRASCSRKRKRKKMSQKLSESNASFDMTVNESDVLDLNGFHSTHDPVSGSSRKRKRKKKSEKQQSESDSSFGIMGSVLESDISNGFLSPHDPVSDNSQKPKRKKKSRKLASCDAVSDIISLVQKPDRCDNDVSCQSKIKSRKLSQSEAVISVTHLVEESDSIACNDNQARHVPVSVKSHKHKRKKKLAESATLHDVTSSILDTGSPDSPSQNVPTSGPQKRKKKPHKLAESASDVTTSVQETENHDCNGFQGDSGSVCSRKRKKKSRQLSQSDSVSAVTCLVEESNSHVDSRAQCVPVSHSSHKHKRKKTSNKLAESDTLCDVTSSVLDAGSPVDCKDSSLKRKKKKKHHKLPESHSLSDLTNLVPETSSVDFYDSPSRSEPASMKSQKCKKKKKSEKLVDSDTLSDLTNLEQQADSLDCSESTLQNEHASGSSPKRNRKHKRHKLVESDSLQACSFSDVTGSVLGSGCRDCIDTLSMNISTPVSSQKRKKKKKSHKLAESDTLSDLRTLTQQADILGCSDIQHVPVDTKSRTQKRKKNSHKLAESDTLCDLTTLAQQADILDCSDIQHVPESAMAKSRTHKRKKKSHKLAESDTLSDLTTLAQQADSLDCSEMHVPNVLASVKSHTHTKRKNSHKLAESDTVSDLTNLVQEANYLDVSNSRSQNVPASISSRKCKKKKKSNKLAESETSSDVTGPELETGSVDCNDSRKRKRKKKKTRKLSENDVSPDVALSMWERDSGKVNDSQLLQVPAPESSPERENESTKRAQPETSLIVKETSNVNDTLQISDSRDSSKRRQKSRTKCVTSSDTDGAENVTRVASAPKSKRTKNSSQLETLPEFTEHIAADDSGNDCSSETLQSTSIGSSSESTRRQKAKQLPEAELVEAAQPETSFIVKKTDNINGDDTRSLQVRDSPDSSNKTKKKSKTKCVTWSDTDEAKNATSRVARAPKLKRRKKLAPLETLPESTGTIAEDNSEDNRSSETPQSMSTGSSPEATRKRKANQLPDADLDETPQPGASFIVKETDNVNDKATRSLKIRDSRDSRYSSKIKKKSRTKCVASSESDEAENDIPRVASAPKLKRRKKSSQLETLPESTERIAQDSSGNNSSSETVQSTSGNRSETVQSTSGNSSETVKSTSIGTSDETTRTRKTNQQPDGALDDTTEPCENAESNDSSVGVSNLQQVDAKHLCPSYRHAARRIISVEASEDAMLHDLRAVENDDEQFANVLHYYEGNVSYSRFRKIEKILRDAGLATHGRNWSVTELAQLRANWETFCEEFPEAQADKMLGRCECAVEEKQHIRHLIKDEGLYLRLGVKIRRHLCQIYNRARSLLVHRPVTKVTQAAHAMLTDLHKTVGNKWSLIAQEMGMTAHMARKACKPPTKVLKKGQWSREEDTLLKDTLRATVGDNLLELDPALFTWRDIAKKIPGRDEAQCYHHWYNIIESRLKMEAENITPDIYRATGRMKTNITNAQVVKSIDSLGIDCASQIDWKRLQQLMEENAPVVIYRSRWNKLRSRVPDHKNKTFTEIMQHLKQTWCVEHTQTSS